MDLTYGDYLKLSQLLSSQSPSSKAHDEMLFIIVHQAYELWFKQIIHELDSIRILFDAPKVEEKDLGIVVSRLTRVIEIQKLLVSQIQIIETMTPLDFLEFRGYLPGASGFQSKQFRMVENKLGLLPNDRLSYGSCPYHASYTPEDKKLVLETESQPSLFTLVERWLERTPFTEYLDFNFIQVFNDTFHKINSEDKEYISTVEGISENERELRLKWNNQAKEYVETILDKDKFEKLRSEGKLRLSYKAFISALFINLYRDRPILFMPFKLLEALIDIDEQLSLWRHRHSLMVLRMIGAKIGTGGSSGHEYLASTIEKHSIFKDLFMISSFYIPRSTLPPLSLQVEKDLGFAK